MELMDKLRILTGAAKYDVACTSSGVDRKGLPGALGNSVAGGICHSFAADGRCISLLKILMSNACIHDCKYCACRSSSDAERATLTPEELADLTISFYRRNYIEGLFLSSGVVGSPDATTERMIRAIARLREVHGFRGYIHAKGIPGASPALVERLGALVDRISINIELPSESSLSALAPGKDRAGILAPMAQIAGALAQRKQELAIYRHVRPFAPAGQSTQMIVGASPETDLQILRLSQGLYKRYQLRRVFFSAYIPVGDSRFLPEVAAPLLREHRLYQADFLLRQYGFDATEILEPGAPWLDARLDPKCLWALRHPQLFPMEVQRADYLQLLRVPGIGPIGAQRIVEARRTAPLSFDTLKKLGVVLKRAQYFLTCQGKAMPGLRLSRESVYQCLAKDCRVAPALFGDRAMQQLSMQDLDSDVRLGAELMPLSLLSTQPIPSEPAGAFARGGA
ncbi:MAG: putative DNA modification/repair radical SAM protein [Clostridia bacterium]|nr:putative DNA modification/repair radical SAM protein [Clostridia bacterium]